MDVVWKFYCISVKTHHLIQNLSESGHAQNILHLRNHIYKEYGFALGEFMRSVISLKQRYRRDFRIKFADDMDFELLENSLISAAYRIIFSSQNDPSMNSCLPIASELIEKIDMLHISLFSHLKNIESKMRQFMAENNEKFMKDEEDIINKWLSDFVFGSRCILSRYSYHKSEIPNVPNCLKDFLFVSNDIIDFLISLDETIAKFEWKFVNMVARRIRGIKESEDIQRMCVLFSETIQWAVTIGLINQNDITDRDPVLFLCLPRLVLIFGIRLLHEGPISYRKIFNGHRLPYLFRGCIVEIASLARQLLALSQENLYLLIQWIGPNGMPNIAQKYTSEMKNFITDKDYESQKFSHFQGLHYIYKKISTIADTMCSRHASDIRFLMQNSIEMNDVPENYDNQSRISVTSTVESQSPHEERTQSDFEEEEYFNLIEKVSKFSLIDWREILNTSYTDDVQIFQKPRKSAANLKIDCDYVQKLIEPIEVGFDIAKWLQQSHEESLTNFPPDKTKEDESAEPPELCSNSLLDEHNNDPEKEDETNLAMEDKSRVSHDNFIPLWQPDYGLHKDLNVHFQDNETETSSNSEDEYADRTRRLPIQGSVCGICLESFNLFRRRHHCRRCGFVFCHYCSSKKRKLPHSTNQLLRVCNDCNEFLGPIIDES